MSWCQIYRFTPAWKFRLRSGLYEGSIFSMQNSFISLVYRAQRRDGYSCWLAQTSVHYWNPESRLANLMSTFFRLCLSTFEAVRALIGWSTASVSGFLAADWLKDDPPCSTCLVMRGWKILPAVWSRTALFPPLLQWISCAEWYKPVSMPLRRGIYCK